MSGPGQPGRRRGDRSQAMPIVTVHQGPRSVELKRELVKQITDSFVDTYGIPAEAVQVWIHEVPTDSWGTGGKLTADR
ncbi:4-oxalocrotonate tautomerase DmpI [Streptomyces sp. NPDC051162]|uniref:4-oxalocrotonate tautomerase DmpI n=1 Tax=unclassified Streptomyces TaxID=2593676 RepID=UPI0034141DF0